jgi:CBS domain-containing protein
MQMKAKDVMTADVVTVSPDQSVRYAARIMLSCWTTASEACPWLTMMAAWSAS